MPQVQEVGELFAVPIKWENGGPKDKSVCTSVPWKINAILYTLKSFKGIIRGKHVQVLTDNTCAVSHISNMGGSRSPDCNDITKQIWMWCKENTVWVSVSHTPGIMNTEADVLSRQFNDRTEWKLSPDIFHKVTD